MQQQAWGSPRLLLLLRTSPGKAFPFNLCPAGGVTLVGVCSWKRALLLMAEVERCVPVSPGDGPLLPPPLGSTCVCLVRFYFRSSSLHSSIRKSSLHILNLVFVSAMRIAHFCIYGAFSRTDAFYFNRLRFV